MKAPCPAENRADQKETTSAAEPIQDRKVCHFTASPGKHCKTSSAKSPGEMMIECWYCYNFEPDCKVKGKLWYKKIAENYYKIAPEFNRSEVEKGIIPSSRDYVCAKCKDCGPRRLKIGKCYNKDQTAYKHLYLQVLTFDKTSGDGEGPDPNIRIVVGPENHGNEPCDPEQAK